MDTPFTPDEAASFQTKMFLKRFEEEYYKQYPPLSQEIVDVWVAQNHETMSIKFLEQFYEIPSELLVNAMLYYSSKDNPHLVSKEDLSKYERLKEVVNLENPDGSRATMSDLLQTENGTQYVKILSRMADDAIHRESEFWKTTFPEISRIMREKNQSLIDAVPLPTSQACFDACLEGMLSDVMTHFYESFSETEQEKNKD